MEGNGRRVTRWTAAAVGAATFFALAGLAAARLASDSANTTIAPQDNGTATAKCGSGSTAVSGGFAAPGLDPTAETGPAILTYVSAFVPGEKWQASGHNFSRGTASGSGPLVSYAYCDSHDPSVTINSEVAIVDGGGHASITPTCQSQRQAVSGGFVSDTPDTSGLTDYAYTSRRAGKHGWRISVFNPDMSKHRVRAIVYCEKKPPNLVVRTAQKQVPLEQTATAKAKCPKGASPFSGGYKSAIGPESQVGLAFTSKRSAGRSWKVSAIGASAGGSQPKGVISPATETAIVYCST